MGWSDVSSLDNKDVLVGDVDVEMRSCSAETCSSGRTAESSSQLFIVVSRRERACAMESGILRQFFVSLTRASDDSGVELAMDRGEVVVGALVQDASVVFGAALVSVASFFGDRVVAFSVLS